MRDPYSVLGVARTANESDIKRAYRKLAKKYHPDQNADDPNAKERFAEVTQAYEIVGDKDKRRQFDHGEIDAEGKPKFQSHGFGGGFHGFEEANAGRGGFGGGFREAGSGPGAGGFAGGSFDDILNDFLGGFGGGAGHRGPRGGARARAGGPQHQAPAKGNNADVVALVTLEDLVNNNKVRVSLPSGKTVNMSLPKGTVPGDKIRLRGQGHPGAHGGQPGDAMAEVKLKQHKLFKVDGSDLYLDLPVALYEAVLGAKIKVPTLEGAVNLTIPANSSGGKTMRLKGKGLPKKDGTRGDLLVRVQIVLPPNKDEELETLMKAWRDVTPYAARGPEFD